MTAHIVNNAPAIEAEFQAEQLTKIEFTEARMILQGGVFKLNAKDLLPPNSDPVEEKKSKTRQKAPKDAGQTQKRRLSLKGLCSKEHSCDGEGV